MSIDPDTFLRIWGFTADPFATSNAEQERLALPAFFVHVSWFERLFGNPANPESLILFAPRGHGKTSHRLEIARWARNNRPPALVVHFTEFDLLLRNGLNQIQIDTYATVICQMTLNALDDELSRQLDLELRLRAAGHIFDRFCTLLHHFSPVRALQRTMPVYPNEKLLYALQHSALSIKDWIRELWDIVSYAGFVSVYFLIDGVDEWSETTADRVTAAIQMLKPLLDAVGVLQGGAFAFKFFLPQTLENPLRQQQIGRFDRTPVYHLVWTENELRTMLSQRLQHFSRLSETAGHSRVHSFKELCEVDLDIDGRLIQAAQSSPREMLRLARQIIDLHCRTVFDANGLIAAETIDQALGPGEIMSVRPRAEPVAEAAPAPSAEPARLFLDARGDIWLGRAAHQIKWSKLTRRCIEYLWQNRHRTVSYEELQYALYGDDGAMQEQRGDPRSSCDKVVRRVRGLLEPGQHGSRTYIDVQAGTGYVLRNFREEFE